MAKRKQPITKPNVDTIKPTVNATTIHDGAKYYSRQIRTSEVLGNTNQDPKNIITDFDRWNLVNKSRFFVENVPVIKAAVEEIATYSVGEAFNPIFEGQDEEWGKQATEWLSNWYNICDVTGQDMHTILWLSSVCIDRDGDCVLHLTYGQDGKYPQIQLIPSHRICTTDRNTNQFDGVILNDQNRPVGYNVRLSDSHSNGYGNTFNYDSTPSVQLSTQDALMLFEPRYPLQFRGFPSLATSINDWMDYRDIREYEREAIKQAASIALIEKNQVGGVLPGQFQFGMTQSMASWMDPSQPMFWKYYNGGTVRYFGSNDQGAGLEQMKNDRPGDLTQTFLKDHLLRGAFNSIGWPLEIAWDMSGLNSANTRAILAKVERKLLQRQSTLFKLWKRVTLYAVAKAIKLGLIPTPKTSADWYKWTCTYPKSPSIDLGRDSKTAIELYKMGATTLSDIYGVNGENWESKLFQKIKERKRIEEMCNDAGVDVNVIQQLTPNGNPALSPDNSNSNQGNEA